MTQRTSNDQGLHDARADAVENASDFAKQILPLIMVAAGYEEMGARVTWWAAFFTSLHGFCARHIESRERVDAVLAMVKQMVDTTPLGEERH